jgi:polysaccharide export outer membrane protein
MNAHRVLTCRAAALVIAAAVLQAGCGSPGAGPAVAPSAPYEADGFGDADAGRAPERPGMSEAPDEGPEVLRPGDLLTFRLIGDQSADTQTLSVDRGGYVHLPLAGDVHVADRTLTDAERTLQAAIGRYDRLGRVALGVSDAKGRYATVMGAVEHAGNVPLVGEARLADVLATAGGPRTTVTEDRLVEIGDLDGARLIRRGATLPVDARKALQGDLRHNVRVRPGDVILVPPSLAQRVIVLGQVARARTMPFHPGLRLTEALADAGGLTQAADSADVRIVRGGYAHPRVYVASVRDVFGGKRSDPLLAPGDCVYVTEHWLASVGEVLEKLIPAATTALLFGTTAVK